MTKEKPDLIDAEDFHRKQRLKEIHDARQEVAKAVHEMEIDDTRPGVLQAEVQRLGQNLAIYVQELIPLIETGGVDSSYVKLPEEHHHANIREFANTMGYATVNEGMSLGELMQVYEQANMILAELKPLIDNSDDEAAFDYEDIEG